MSPERPFPRQEDALTVAAAALRALSYVRWFAQHDASLAQVMARFDADMAPLVGPGQGVAAATFTEATPTPDMAKFIELLEQSSLRFDYRKPGERNEFAENLAAMALRLGVQSHFNRDSGELQEFLLRMTAAGFSELFPALGFLAAEVERARDRRDNGFGQGEGL